MKKNNILQRFYDLIYEPYNNYIRIPVRDLRIGFSNLWFWLPIIWKTRDWDKRYLMEMLILKLRRHRDYQKNHSHVAEPYNSDKVNSMTECLELLEKVHNEWENYEEPAHDKHEEKWGKTEFYTVPSTSHPNCYELKDRNDERYTEEENKKKSEEFILASRIAGLKRQRDFTVAMEIFVTKFDTWWD